MRDRISIQVVGRALRSRTRPATPARVAVAPPPESPLRRPPESAGQVRQSFSHGRSKTVTVEVRKKRVFAPGSAPEPAAQAEPVVARAPDPPPAAEPARRTLQVPRALTAEEALDWGMVARVVPHDDLLDVAKGLLAQCCRTAPGARGVVKASLDNYLGLFDRIGMQTSLFGPEAREGFRAFKTKTSPTWLQARIASRNSLRIGWSILTGLRLRFLKAVKPIHRLPSASSYSC